MMTFAVAGKPPRLPSSQGQQHGRNTGQGQRQRQGQGQGQGSGSGQAFPKFNHLLRLGGFAKDFAVRSVVRSVSRRLQHVSTSSDKPNDVDAELGVWLSNELASLGPAYMKIGQLVSTRRDIFPDWVTSPLEMLQDNAPKMTTLEVRRVIEEETGSPLSDLFSSIEKRPIASASIGQVHRAVLRHSGRHVVVKVQRPYLDEDFNESFGAIRYIIELSSGFIRDKRYLDVVQVVNETMDSVMCEIDFLQEANNIRMFRKLFQNNENIVVPRAYMAKSTRRLLIMENVPGIKVTDVEMLDKLGVDRKNVAKRLMATFVRGILSHGVFHSDPHPGNVAIDQEGRIILYDYGMVSAFPKHMVSDFKYSIYLLFINDIDALVRMLVSTGVIKIRGRPDAKDLTEYEYTSLYKLLSIFSEYARSLDVNVLRNSMLSDVLLNSDANEFYFDSTMMMLFRAMAILEGNCKTLDPSFNYFDIVDLYIASDFVTDVSFLRSRAEEDMWRIFGNIDNSMRERAGNVQGMLRDAQQRNDVARGNISKIEHRVSVRTELSTMRRDQLVLFVITLACIVITK